MKSETALWRDILVATGMECSVSTTIDLKTADRRIEHEGLQFLTITLPSFEKDFVSCLDGGYVDSTSFSGWKKRRGLPAFLSGFLSRLFDSNDGTLLPDADPFVVQCVRQICLSYSKIDMPCSPFREYMAYRKYIEVDNEVARSNMTEAEKSALSRIGSMAFGPTLSLVDSDIYHDRIVPTHGPGTCENRLSANDRWSCRTWTDRLESIFRSGNFLFPNERFSRDESVHYLSPEQEPPVRVITVPKTHKGPRVIAIEPSWMMFVQQGILDSIVRNLRYSPAYKLVDWSSNSDNHALACIGSRDGHLSTLDLSDASDRVSTSHVYSLLHRYPWFLQGAFACRSTHAYVLGKSYRLAKFASMGSALTFPLESMVFLTVVLRGLELDGYHLTSSSIKRLAGRVRIFGDDIIVPTIHKTTTADLLESYGFKVNLTKSFSGCSFRESCGAEYFRGVDVTVARLRKPLPRSRQDAAGVSALVSFRNRLYWRGHWRLCRSLDSSIEKLLKHFPVVEPTSAAVSRQSVLPFRAERTSAATQQPLVRAVVLRSKPPRDPLGGIGALVKFLTGSTSHSGIDHLERSGRPRAVYTSTGWIQPF